ncbi:MAG: glycosyl transferase family 28 [Chitinophagaceae bacterium]|nr:glycosyl transferase family 28 [Chitinophagaceae bacterium]
MMKPPEREKNVRKLRILVAPLDWGLGHATRCIPLIRELLAQGADVWLAGEGAQEGLLKAEFPELPFLLLPGYRIQYARTARGLVWKMILQGPKMQRAIRYEHRWLQKAVDEHHFDAVISDNRYGLHHASIPCIFITHQLRIKSSVGKQWIENILQKRNYRYINQFAACWVPDAEGDNNLAGELSHPDKKPSVPIYYIGVLSRFVKKEKEETKGHLLVVLSGPEPQRSMLEEKIIRDISHYPGSATIVRGLPGSAAMIPSTNMIHFINHLPADELNMELLKAEYIICRSGYSSVMDIVTVQKKSILIPTPGQTEQEYLGENLMKKGIALCVHQKQFSLTAALTVANTFPYKVPLVENNGRLTAVIRSFLIHAAAYK